VVVAEIADDGLAAGLSFGEVDEPRAGTDEGVAAEAPALDRLEQEARTHAVTQPQVGPERGDQIG
jgi:hypothetical protein